MYASGGIAESGTAGSACGEYTAVRQKGCIELASRLRAATQADRVQREVDELRERVKRRTESLARRFDRVLRILGAWGYLEGWVLTDAGDRLARLFHESDLLVLDEPTNHLDIDAITWLEDFLGEYPGAKDRVQLRRAPIKQLGRR